MKLPKHVSYIDDERGDDNGIIVTLAKGYYWADEPDCGVRGFDTMSEVREAIKKANVIFAAPKSAAAV
jgi:hypothetical protein